MDLFCDIPHPARYRRYHCRCRGRPAQEMTSHVRVPSSATPIRCSIRRRCRSIIGRGIVILHTAVASIVLASCCPILPDRRLTLLQYPSAQSLAARSPLSYTLCHLPYLFTSLTWTNLRSNYSLRDLFTGLACTYGHSIEVRLVRSFGCADNDRRHSSCLCAREGPTAWRKENRGMYHKVSKGKGNGP